jgi:hypothetical protein|tara:strand:+ start:718 stop:960 length:243 start_codon:yes stop_codon:yes gene_type:complete
MLKADGLDDAIIGVTERCGDPRLIAYDCGKIIRIFMQRDGMTEEDAMEFLSYNVTGAYMGEGTPIFVWPQSIEDINASDG